MSISTINDEQATELLQFLDGESALLTRVERCAAQIGKHPVGRAFTNELIESLASLQRDIAGQNLQRATLKSRLSVELLKTPSAIRFSTIQSGPETNQQLQETRKAVLQKALSVESNLRTVMSQLTESNVVVTAVLESILGAPVDRSRYDSQGKPVQQVSRVEGQRVA